MLDSRLRFKTTQTYTSVERRYVIKVISIASSQQMSMEISAVPTSQAMRDEEEYRSDLLEERLHFEFYRFGLVGLDLILRRSSERTQCGNTSLVCQSCSKQYTIRTI